MTEVDEEGYQERVLYTTMGPGHTTPKDTHDKFKDHVDYGIKCIALHGNCPSWKFLDSKRPKNVVYESKIQTCENEKLIPAGLNYHELIWDPTGSEVTCTPILVHSYTVTDSQLT